MIGSHLRVAIAVLAATATVSCAGVDDPDAGSPPAPTNPSARPPLSDESPPTLTLPTLPPTVPSDPQPVAIIAGRIVADSSGPCYLVQTDDGLDYAVHHAGAGRLVTGTTVRIKVSRKVSTSDCPGGIPVEAALIEPVG